MTINGTEVYIKGYALRGTRTLITVPGDAMDKEFSHVVFTTDAKEELPYVPPWLDRAAVTDDRLDH